MDRITNPKDSNVYSMNNQREHTTPSGSHNSASQYCYKHQIPSGLKEEYMKFLNIFEIEFKDEYLFEWIE
jgi:hypothetical protein